MEIAAEMATPHIELRGPEPPPARSPTRAGGAPAAPSLSPAALPPAGTLSPLYTLEPLVHPSPRESARAQRHLESGFALYEMEPAAKERASEAARAAAKAAASTAWAAGAMDAAAAAPLGDTGGLSPRECRARKQGMLETHFHIS
jgi:hypothetical protein